MTWWKVVLVLLGVPLAGVLLFVGWVWVSFSGGLDDVLDLHKPEEGDPEVVAAEERARDEVPGLAAEVGATVREALEPDAVQVDGGVAPPTCAVGQHNFKIDDDYDLSCTLTAIDVVSAPTADSGTARQQVDAALRDDGWRRVQTTHTTARPGSAASQDDSPGRYTREHDGQAWQLVVDEASWSTMTFELRGHEASELRDDAGRPVSLEQLVGAAPRDGYAVVVGVSVEYFRD